jgi:hypothetical protein
MQPISSCEERTLLLARAMQLVLHATHTLRDSIILHVPYTFIGRYQMANSKI